MRSRPDQYQLGFRVDDEARCVLSTDEISLFGGLLYLEARIPVKVDIAAIFS